MGLELNKKYNRKLKTYFFLRDNEWDEIAYEDAFKHQYHLPKLKKEPDSVLDLGSNIGLTMAHYRYLWPAAKIQGYEIDPENIYLSKLNAYGEIVNRRAVTTIKYPAYKAKGSPQAYKAENHFLLRGEFERIIGVTLDQALNGMNTRDGCVDFVKMDIEGEEYKTLQSHGAWSNRIRNLLVECHGEDEDDTEEKTEEIEGFLEEQGFQVEKHEPHWSALYAWKKI